MAMKRALATALLGFVCAPVVWSCDFSSAFYFSPAPTPMETVSLAVPAGTVIQVALAEEVRVRKVGQSIQGRLVEPLYAFDQEVVPVGSEVWGRITELEGTSGQKRFWAALNANFTPARKVEVEFDEIILEDGAHIPINAVVTPGSGRPIRLVTTVDNAGKKTVKDVASEKMKQAVQEAKRQWQTALKQVKEPGRMHRLKRFTLAQLPVHPQYIDAGAVYFAELQEPLDFGSKPLPPVMMTSLENDPPPCGVLAHAQLVTPLSSATTQKDEPVEAIFTRPLFSEDRLVFPQGTRLTGSVAQVQPARRLRRNGKLRINFTQLVPPDGVQRQVDANLEGIQAGQDQHLHLGPEGGSRATSPKRRYLSTGVAVTLAVASYQDSDAEDGVTDTSGTASQGAAGGAAGFKLIGIVVGAFTRSRPLALGMGIYGAARSGYSNFLAPGQEVVFPKGTGMEIGVWLARRCEESSKTD